MEGIDRNSLYAIFLEILKLHHNKAHNYLESLGLYPGQPPLLFILNKENGKSQRELAEMMNVKASTMNVMIKRMEKSGFIERKKDSEDARLSRVYITDMGKDVCKKSHIIMKELEEEMFYNLNREEEDLCRKLLLQIKDNLSPEN